MFEQYTTSPKDCTITWTDDSAVWPLVKNLPAMWKLYKGLKDAPSEEKQKMKVTNELQ